MKINEIKLNMGRTVNTGNYESLRIDVEFSATLEDNDDIRKAMENLRASVKMELNRVIQTEQKKRNAEDYF
jgi:hypothetical protein